MASVTIEHTMTSSSSPHGSEIVETQHKENAPTKKNLSKKIFTRQLSMSENQRELAWEKKRHKKLVQEQKKELTIQNPNEVCDHDLNELKGCIELGFGFNEEKGGQTLTKSLPALDLYFAVNRLGSPTTSPRCTNSPTSKFSAFGSSSFKSLDEGFSSDASNDDSWKICSPGDDPQQVKTKLKQWAQVVACSVMQSS
ncbi:uncharacterized protein [Rutidosis leptorrhynchoides]|uniref:uncharacterized protein n=1 Tax=Rutidosis leptorrhynchoides TaxID=125765 RepID=UPI003A998C94